MTPRAYVAADNRLDGASVVEQELFDALVAHEREEAEVIAAYEALAAEVSSDSVRYLVRLVLDDETRHHKVLTELANKVRAQSTREECGARVPDLDVRRGDGALLEATRRFLTTERKDRAQLKRLARKARAGSGSAIDAFVVELMGSDTERHIRILRFIEHLVRQSPLR